MKKIELKTKRLILRPMTIAELDKTVLMQEDGELRQAYSEMLELCRAHPEQQIWYAPWTISLKKEGTHLGDVGFKGGPVKGAVEVGYGLEEAARGKGYMTEALKAITEWAFSQKDVYIVEAETEPDNEASRRVLEKNGFKPCGEGKEGPRFSKEKPQVQYLPVYMCLGVSIGTSFGTAAGNLSIGMSMGIAVGLALGAALDSSERKHRAEVTGKTE